MTEAFDIGSVSPRRYFAAVAIVLGLLFALISPDDGGPALRTLLQWQLQSCLPMLLLVLAHMAWLRLSWFERVGPWGQLLMSGISGAALFAAPGLLIDIYLMGEPEEQFGVVALLHEFWSIWPPVTLSWMAINAPFVLGLRLQPVAAASTGDPAMPPGDSAVQAPDAELPAFMQLVAPSLRGELLYLQAELHYLAVVTTSGRSLILYNLRDAIEELPAGMGLQTHRSFWVVLSRVKRSRRSGRQAVLVMPNGDEVPVSRRRRADVDAKLLGAAA